MQLALQRLIARPSCSGLHRILLQASPLPLLASFRQRRTSICGLRTYSRRCGPFRAPQKPKNPSLNTVHDGTALHKTPLKDFDDVDASDHIALITWLIHAKSLLRPNRPSSSALQPGWDALAKLLASGSADVEAQAIWDLIRPRWKILPHPGSYKTRTSSLTTIWTAIFELGFKDPKMMDEIYAYTTANYAGRKQFSALYIFVLEHLIAKGHPEKAVHWYDVLSSYDRPTSTQFGRLVTTLISDRSGSVDTSALKETYIRSGIRDAYQHIIPVLIHKEAFHEALEWHMFLKDHGDLSPSKHMSRPLAQLFSRMEEIDTHAISPDVNSTNPSRLETSSDAVDKAMSLTRGERQPTYPNWVAHLLATKWVKLDISINTLHALGIQALGPLPLQAIALREPTAADIVKRLDQLNQRGITINERNVYSRALISFARCGQDELLQSLLQSDQHPEEFQDAALQRQLIHRHEVNGEWQQARLLRAVQLVAAVDPVAERHNFVLQGKAKAHDLPGIIRTLEVMRRDRIFVKVSSIRQILRSVLRPRQKGHRPDLLDTAYHDADNDLAISILKNIMVYGSYVPAMAWSEVTRRLGMIGRLDDMHSLSLWLADAYNPQKLATNAIGLAHDSLTSAIDLDSSHDLHPLRILFGDVRQRSIVEWSFIHGMVSVSSSIRDRRLRGEILSREQEAGPAIKKIMAGIHALKELEKRGVYISESNVKRACYKRLVILYGPGLSSRKYNRAVRQHNPVRLNELVQAIHEAWGKRLWHVGSLERRIMEERNWDARLSEM